MPINIIISIVDVLGDEESIKSNIEVLGISSFFKISTEHASFIIVLS